VGQHGGPQRAKPVAQRAEGDAVERDHKNADDSLFAVRDAEQDGRHEDGAGKYTALLIETRGFKGPRGFGSDTPMHEDNETVIKERISVDKQDANLVHDEFTISDHSLAKDWVVTKTYKREATPPQEIWWREAVCVENNPHLKIAGEDYMLSGDGMLMPTHQGQQPPDLRYFKPAQK